MFERLGAGCGRRPQPTLMSRHLAIATLYKYVQYNYNRSATPIAATVTIAAEGVHHENSVKASLRNQSH